MGDPRTPAPRRQLARRASPSSRNARAVERDILRAPGRMRLEAASPRFLLALADRLPLLQGVAYRRHLGADTHCPSREAASPSGPRAVPEAPPSSTRKQPRPPSEAALADTTAARR